jgi:pimeloyl-ACP methyl ester carboxylesterase
MRQAWHDVDQRTLLGRPCSRTSLTAPFGIARRRWSGAMSTAFTEDHFLYSKRAMAQELMADMDTLGFSTFTLIGHDRGGRVCFRMAMDHPQRVGADDLIFGYHKESRSSQHDH